ncbi:hypothetical protein Pmar_PMAR003490 [Perkinsus marinus ATCC 50983]|uniref:Uncharacterized protein n=2 Tax=Perkinsus marinus (strain ATCC 50983 / TXsc) TaxID=423536 RepID=C5KHG5_PERM5|nr:hypothetical protein Pmar_PMAR003490 [Perkinsus marinus ATCC 50983]EER16027.1 hypothetical protein Pmar_PMAR003490 [Perkinsus marinus ATCC 50983]|eukprot:XP_002784231.1 hypothetical protein Pmar_PMAR003490 [Perkinsus marinus ATCC 50983]
MPIVSVLSVGGSSATIISATCLSSAATSYNVRITRDDDEMDDFLTDKHKSSSETTTTTAAEEVCDDDYINLTKSDSLEIEGGLGGFHFGDSPMPPTGGYYLFLIPSSEEV